MYSNVSDGDNGMFFFGIFGTGNGKKEIRLFNNVVCPICGRYTRFHLIFTYCYFHFFFIPLFKFGKKYILLPDCGCSYYEADKEYFEELKSSDGIDFSRLNVRETRGGERVCPRCGKISPQSFAFCPYCGERL